MTPPAGSLGGVPATVSARVASAARRSWPNDYGAVLLVPVDGSLASLMALTVARNLAATTGAVIRLLYVSSEAAITERDALRLLGLSKRELHGAVLDCLRGPPFRVILDAARRLQPRVVVLGFTAPPSGQRGFGRVAESLLHSSPSPVLLVRLATGGRLARAGGQPRRVLLPLDGTPSTAELLAPAVLLAGQAGAELDILHVAGRGLRRPEEPGTLTAPPYVDQPQHEWPSWTSEFLDRFCHVLGRCPRTITTRLVLGTGVPSRVILAHARRRESDLIILEWRGVEDLRATAAARAVVANAPCPVLLIRGSSLPAARTR